MITRSVTQHRFQPAQAAVEFSLAFMIFTLLVFGGIEVARAVFDLHGLSRAAEITAHQLAEYYDTTSPPPPITSRDAATALQMARQDSDLAFSTAEPTTVTEGFGYQQLSNGSAFICGSSDLTNPRLIHVTVQEPFKPLFSRILGGLTITLSETATALTYKAESGDGTDQDYCP